MVSPSMENRRRSSRVFARIPVKVRGVDADGEKFRESSQTVVVNVFGGLIYLNHDVEEGAQIQLTNIATEEEQDCRVVFLGDNSERGQRVGIEFLSPAPHFWGIELAMPEASPRKPSR